MSTTNCMTVADLDPRIKEHVEVLIDAGFP
jgi:hypothetical protein